MDRTRIRELRRKLQLGTMLSDKVIVRLELEDRMSPVLRTVVAEAEEHIAKNEADEAVADGHAFVKALGDRVTGAMQRDESAVVARMREALGTPKGMRSSPERAILHDIKAMIALNIAQGYVEHNKVIGRHRERVPVRNVWYTAEECHVNGWIVDEVSRHLGWDQDFQRDMYRLRNNRTLIEQCAHQMKPRDWQELTPGQRCQRDAAGPGKRFCELHTR